MLKANLGVNLKIFLEGIGKKFNTSWIFKNINFVFEPGGFYAITGANGSGKSTLLQIIYSLQIPSSGNILYQKNGTELDVSKAFQEFSFAAPYMELLEDFTLAEMLRFHFKFKKSAHFTDAKAFADKIMLGNSFHKPIRNFSSGMKQRLRLGLAFYSNSPVLLIDEPTSNLDKAGIEWYENLLSNYTKNQENTLIVCSNIEAEYKGASQIISIANYS